MMLGSSLSRTMGVATEALIPATASAVTELDRPWKATAAMASPLTAVNRVPSSCLQHLPASIPESGISRMSQFSDNLFRVPRLLTPAVVRIVPEFTDDVLGDDASVTQVDNDSSPYTYELRFPSLSVLLKIDDPDNLTQPMHYFVLSQVEQQLRRIVEERLSLLYGSQWIERCVPDQIRARWVKQRRRDRQARQPLIQYSGFPDLRIVIIEPDNWQAFEPIFGHRDEIAVSLRRLHPVRNSIAHCRPLSEDQKMTLFYEARWILIRIGHRNVI